MQQRKRYANILQVVKMDQEAEGNNNFFQGVNNQPRSLLFFKNKFSFTFYIRRVII